MGMGAGASFSASEEGGVSVERKRLTSPIMVEVSWAARNVGDEVSIEGSRR